LPFGSFGFPIKASHDLDQQGSNRPVFLQEKKKGFKKPLIQSTNYRDAESQ